MMKYSSEKIYAIMIGLIFISYCMIRYFIPVQNSWILEDAFALIVFLVGFMGISFSVGLLWNRMPPVVRYIIISGWSIGVLSGLVKGMTVVVHKGSTQLTGLSYYIVIMFVTFLLPYYLGCKISHPHKIAPEDRFSS